MSLSINSIGSNSTMMAQLQKMQQQMKTLQMAAAGVNNEAPAKDAAVPVINDTEHDQLVDRKDNVGAFAQMLKDAFENVNNLQNESSNKQHRFDLGDRSVTLSDVILTSQRAGLAFDATVQIRNRLIESYRTISQMQV